jgi:Domain of unknown function (DUF4386)
LVDPGEFRHRNTSGPENGQGRNSGKRRGRVPRPAPDTEPARPDRPTPGESGHELTEGAREDRGVSYVLLFGAAFNEGYVLPRIVKAGDPAATADNIRASTTLLRIGFRGDLMAAVFWLLTAMAPYLLLKHVDQLAAGAMVVFAAVGAAVMTLNQLNQYTALTVATGPEYSRAFGRPGADGLALLFATMRGNGYVIDSGFPYPNPPTVGAGAWNG